MYKPNPCTCAASAWPAPKSSAVDPLFISSAYSCLSKRLPFGRLLRSGAKPSASRMACSSSSFTLLISSFIASSESDCLSLVYHNKSFPGRDSQSVNTIIKQKICAVNYKTKEIHARCIAISAYFKCKPNRKTQSGTCCYQKAVMPMLVFIFYHRKSIINGKRKKTCYYATGTPYL